jgi:hypothetical protein
MIVYEDKILRRESEFERSLLRFTVIARYNASIYLVFAQEE